MYLCVITTVRVWEVWFFKKIEQIMNKKILFIALTLLSSITFAQNISFTFVNAKNTNDGTNDYYEADIYIASDVDFKLGSGQIYFTYNTAAFGTNIHTNSNFEYSQPSGSILGETYSGFPAYKDFIVNDNTTSRVSTSFQQGLSSGTITANNITSTPKHLFSIKIKYTDVNEEPTVAFETGGVFLDQFFTACGPATFGFPDCTNEPGTQITGDSFDSAGAVVVDGVSWTGNTDSDWSVTGNWSGGALPITTDDVTIPNVATTPQITTGDNIQINSLSIDASSSLQVSGSGAINVTGNFTNNGTVTMSSNASTSSSLIVQGTANGTVTYQRGDLVANQWYVISAPVTGQSIKEFAENVANDIRINTTVTPNRYAIAYYDDSNSTGSKWVYYTTDDLATNALTFESGRGYAISRATNGSVSFTGNLENSSVAKAITASEWNAVGNPFTAFLPINENSGDNFIADNSGSLDPSYVAAYIWDQAQNKYVPNSLVSSENSLAPGQGFLVKAATSANSITLDQDQRLNQPATGGTFSKASKSDKQTIKLLVSNGKLQVNTLVILNETATEGLDPGYDIGNYGKTSFDIFTRLVEDDEGIEFAIQSLATPENKSIIPLGIKATANSKLQLTMEANNIPQDLELYLEDTKENTLQKLDNSTIEIDVIEDNSERFKLHLLKASKTNIDPTIITDNTLKVFTIESDLIVEGISEGEFTLNLYNTQGVKVLETKRVSDGKTIIKLPKLATGIYLANVQYKEGNKQVKLIIKQ